METQTVTNPVAAMNLKAHTGEKIYDEVLRSIVDYAYATHDFSEKALDNARHVLVDSMGCVFEGLSQSPELQKLVAPGPLTAIAASNGARAPGLEQQCDLLRATFAMGAMIRYLDHNDAFPGAEWGHPSDNLGSILPLSDLIDRKSRPVEIKTVLEALIKAYEIQGVFQIKNAFNRVGLDHTILVKVASTAISSWLLGLSKLQALSAVSHAWMDGHALRAFRQYPNTGPRKGWAAGDACMRAVLLAQLAETGQPGAPSILTAPQWGFYETLFKNKSFELPQPFGNWVMENTLFKVFAAGGHALTAVEAALAISQNLREQGYEPARDIAHIEIRTQEAAMRIIDKTRPLNNAADRDHCMRYMVAVVLLKGAMIEVPDYQDTSVWATDPRVETLRARMSMYEDPAITTDYNDTTRRTLSNGITVQLHDGPQLPEVFVEFPIGHARRTDTLPAVRSKARKNLGDRLGAERAEKVLSLLEERDGLDAMRVADFVDLLGTPSMSN